MTDCLNHEWDGVGVQIGSSVEKQLEVRRGGVLISVIIPLFHGQQYIQHLLEMFIRNKKKLKAGASLEIIFVNDCPQENITFSETASAGINVTLIVNQRNSGIHASRVEGLKQAAGKYVLFFDQDDDVADNYLQSQLSHIGEADAVFCNGIIRGGKIIYKDKEAQDAVIQKNYFLAKGCFIVSPGQVLLRRDIIPNYWKDNLMIHNGADDAFLWTLLLCSGIRFVSNYFILYTHNESDYNASINYLEMIDTIREWGMLVERCEQISLEDKELLSKTLEQSCEKRRKILDEWNLIAERVIGIINTGGYDVVSIYGWGIRGQRLYNLLRRKGVGIHYAIDVAAKDVKEQRCPVILPEEVKDERSLMLIAIEPEEGRRVKEFFAKYQRIETVLVMELI